MHNPKQVMVHGLQFAPMKSLPNSILGKLNTLLQAMWLKNSRP